MAHPKRGLIISFIIFSFLLYHYSVMLGCASGDANFLDQTIDRNGY